MTRTFSIKTGENETPKDFITRFKQMCKEVRSQLPSRCIAVSIAQCDSVGKYDTSMVMIFDSFIAANSLLNSQMYTNNALEVCEIDLEHDKLTNVLSKCYDSYSYGRMAMISAKNIDDPTISFWSGSVYGLKDFSVNICI